MLAVRRIAAALGVTSWMQIIEITEHRTTKAKDAPQPSPAGELHIHLKINDDQTVAAALEALLTAGHPNNPTGVTR